MVTELKNARVMQLQLRACQVMERHSSDGEVLVLMLKGKASFIFDQREPVTIQTGQLLHPRPKENHVVRVLEDMVGGGHLRPAMTGAVQKWRTAPLDNSVSTAGARMRQLRSRPVT